MASPPNSWHPFLKNTIQQLKAVQSDEDIELVIEPPKPPSTIKQQSKNDALSFYLNRVRDRNKTVDLQANFASQRTAAFPQNQQQSLLSKEVLKAHSSSNNNPNLRGSDKSGKNKEVIDVDEASLRKNVQKYKQSIFEGPHRPLKLPLRNPDKEMKKQIKIIEDMNKPQWISQKEERQIINRQKYPLSYTHSYLTHFAGVGTDSDQAHQNFLKKRSEHLIQNKEKRMLEKQQQRKKEEEETKLRRQKQRQEEANYLNEIIGLEPKKKVKPNQECVEINDKEEINEEVPLKNNQILQQVIAEQEVSKEIPNEEVEEAPKYYHEPSKVQQRFGLRDIVKPYHSSAPNFVNVVLRHRYEKQWTSSEIKRIPDYFQDQSTYKKAFHYLITNQCIADLRNRLKTVTVKGEEPLKITIQNIKTNTEGQLELYLKQVESKEPSQDSNKTQDSFQLKNFSLSKYRLALVSSLPCYQQQLYGVPSFNRKDFAFICLLVTPQTKQDLGSQVKALACVRQSQLELLLKRKKSRAAYLFDLDKLTTNIRQYIAVTNIVYSELAPEILDPRKVQSHQTTYVQRREVLDEILSNLKLIFNQTQFLSIRQMVLRERGFVLLQGPPGTGKTSTLMGLLSAQYEYLQKVRDTRKIMICAPSNAAVDHIVKRIICEGLFNGEGEIIRPKILRLGIVQSEDPDVRGVYLDEICQKKMLAGREREKEMSKMTTVQIKQKIISLQKQLRKLVKKDLEAEHKAKEQEIRQFQSLLYDFKREKFVISRKSYTQIQNQLLDEAEIILTTLTSSGNDKMDRLRGEIACLIVDQAAQATEPNLLISLQTGVQKVLLIGDPYQLPATCISQDANVTLFNRSLFQRFLDAQIKPYFLNIQYRMAPIIRTFPSRRFYHDRLIDAESIISRPAPSFLQNFTERSVIYIDIKYGIQKKKGDSYCNQEEARMLSLLIRCLIDRTVTLGLITPYQAQRRTIVRDCHACLKGNAEDSELFENVMINTVDSFQGQEKDIILVSTVRANSFQNVGFLTDQRRINVTLTRAKFLLIVVGHSDTIGSNEVWNDFLSWVEGNKCFYTIQREADVDSVLQQVFQQFNQQKIHRRRYSNFSKDIRKVRRNEIQSNDFRSNGETDKVPNFVKESKHQLIKEDNGCRMDLHNLQNREIDQSQKHALNSTECKQILEAKRQREAQALQFQETMKRMNQFQAENYQKLRGDECYRHLLD